MVTAVKSPAKTTRTNTAAPKRTVVKKVALKAPAVKTKAVSPAPVAPVAEKIKATKKPKLVRDSFTMPKDEYAAIDLLKQRVTGLQRHAKKSELIRAGIMALTAMDDKQLATVLAKVPALKTGRPVRS